MFIPSLCSRHLFIKNKTVDCQLLVEYCYHTIKIPIAHNKMNTISRLVHRQSKEWTGNVL